ncbi:hypothetical protein ABLN87_19390 [Ruegeria sp. SCPT10]|uniref:hypothetical protein n=1 Tax=Ruegeria sp. SCP10 TaxID=3141377 RepID=UPI0033358D49
MAKKDFVMIETALLRRKSFHSLETCSERNAYLTATLSSQANYIGVFRYPLDWFSSESKIPVEDLVGVVGHLEDVGLIEYDLEEENLRLRDWFYTSNIRTSANTVKRAARDFLKSDVPRIASVSRAAAEFVVASLKGVSGYGQESDHGPKVFEVLRGFLCRAVNEFPEIEASLLAEMEQHGIGVKLGFDEVFLGLIEGEAIAARAISAAPSKGLPSGSDAPTEYKTTPDHTETKNKGKPYASQQVSVCQDRFQKSIGPTASTLNSPLALAAKKV